MDRQPNIPLDKLLRFDARMPENLGWNARVLGTPMSACPYWPIPFFGAAARQAWLDGWAEADAYLGEILG